MQPCISLIHNNMCVLIVFLHECMFCPSMQITDSSPYNSTDQSMHKKWKSMVDMADTVNKSRLSTASPANVKPRSKTPTPINTCASGVTDGSKKPDRSPSPYRFGNFCPYWS